MNNKKFANIFSKQSMAESRRSDEIRKNHLSGHQKKTNSTDQSISSPSLQLSVFQSGRGTIDAQTYVDAQSNGLTKRIVRYDEESKKTPNVYNRAYKRPGDFPIVHLDKPKLVLTPKRSFTNSPKIAKIGQPDPCINRANVRAEILRNGTMMPPISLDRRENGDNDRVIVDPLDALKEISRKRIHCEDTINTIQPSPITEKDSTDSATITNHTSKRQRIGPSFSSPSANETSKKASNYSKSNEILSSLSSSSYMLSDSLKRAKVTSPNNSISPPQAKRLQSEQQNETPAYKSVPISSVPKVIEASDPEVVEKIIPTESNRPKLTLFNRPYSADSSKQRRNSSDYGDELNIPFVKPRPMTARSRESVENWLKIKPDDKRRLSLMLKCLSGDVDDDSDTVDAVDKKNESSKAVESTVEENSSKSISSEKIISLTTATTTAPIAVLPSKPSTTFTPLSSTNTVILPVITSPSVVSTAQVLPVKPTSPAVEERKGGFSFPLTTTQATHTTATSSVTSSSSLIISASPPLAIVTPSLAPSLPIVTTKEPTVASNPTVSFTFHPPKTNVTSAAVTSVEPTKPTFTFGNVTTNESKTTPASKPSFVIETAKQTTSGKPEDVAKPITTFGQSAPFGQSATTIGNVDFGKTVPTIPPSTVTPSSSNPSIFGTMTSSNAFNKIQQPSFGSKPTDKMVNIDKPFQSNVSGAFASKEQNPVFGSAFPNNSTTSNTQQSVDPRTSAVAKSFSNPIANTTATSSSTFAFGASTNSLASFKTTQPVLTSSSSFGSKTTNTTANIFGSVRPQQQQQQQGNAATSIFGSSTNPNLFNQASKVESMKSPLQNSIESEKNVATQNIFGSSAPKPSFTFSSNNQASSNNIFGGQASGGSGTGNAFTFGGSSNQKSDSSSGNSLGTSKSFTFSANNNESKPVTFGTTKSATPIFGSSNVTDPSKSSVGFTTNNQSVNLFGNKSEGSNDATKVFSFGGSSNTNATPSFGTSTTSSSSSFGSTSSYVTAASTFGGTNSAPTFGGTNSAPTFGGTNSTSTFGGTNATSPFGGTNATPSFGGTNTTSPFGGTNATPSFGTNSAAVVFGANTAAPSFGAGTNATPSFGGANAIPSFGGSSSGSNSGSMFGGNVAPSFTTSTGSADANRTFNFAGGDPLPSPVPNLFNIGPGSQAPRGRTIRTATRRNYR